MPWRNLKRKVHRESPPARAHGVTIEPRTGSRPAAVHGRRPARHRPAPSAPYAVLVAAGFLARGPVRAPGASGPAGVVSSR